MTWRNWYRLKQPRVLRCAECKTETDELPRGRLVTMCCQRFDTRIAAEDAAAAFLGSCAGLSFDYDFAFVGAFPDGEAPPRNARSLNREWARAGRFVKDRREARVLT